VRKVCRYCFWFDHKLLPEGMASKKHIRLSTFWLGTLREHPSSILIWLDNNSARNSVWPFYRLSPAELGVAKVNSLFSEPRNEDGLHFQHEDFSKTRFAAIFVFHDPRNWALDGMMIEPDQFYTDALAPDSSGYL